MPSGNREPDSQQQIDSLQRRIAALEAALLESENNFRTLTDSAPVGIYLDDPQGRAIYINKKCAELVGVPADDALNFDWANFLHPGDRERVFSEWQNAFENSARFQLEYRYVHADGKVVWTLGEVVPILGDDGKATMFIGALTDITARKQAEMEKQALEVRLAQAQKMESIGRLAGGVAHDYNNMLSAIINYTELAMAEVEQTGSVHKKLREVLKAATRSAEVTRQLLSFARQQVVLPDVFDINDAVGDICEMLKRLIGEDIDLVWLPQAGCIPIKMDPAQIDQIVVNLCINARDAIAGVGKIIIETATVTGDDAGPAEPLEGASREFVRLTVSDNGSGMDEAVLEKIFEPFFTTKDQHAGTGLGLASVYGAVKQNAGFIDVHSQPGAGTTFDVYLPVHEGETDGCEGQTTADRALDPDASQRGTEETILIVEDEVSILEAVADILKNLNYQVLAAKTPSEALSLARHHNGEIDLLITDVIMPEMNGREMVDQMRANWPQLQCLYMSGYAADVIANHGTLQEHVDFIQKPFRVADLIAKVRDMLNNPDVTLTPG